MRVFAVDHSFTHGAWSYLPGDILSEEDLQVREMLPDQSQPFRRSAIREITSLEDLAPMVGRATFSDAAIAQAAALLGVDMPPPEPDPELADPFSEKDDPVE